MTRGLPRPQASCLRSSFMTASLLCFAPASSELLLRRNCHPSEVIVSIAKLERVVRRSERQALEISGLSQDVAGSLPSGRHFVASHPPCGLEKVRAEYDFVDIEHAHTREFTLGDKVESEEVV